MALTQVVFAYNISAIKLGGTGCSTTLPDSCDGQNTICQNGTCVCETGYYDSDGDGESGTCIASKYHKRLVQMSSKYPLFIPQLKSWGYRNEPGSVRRLSVRPSINVFMSTLYFQYRSEYFYDTSE